MNLPQKMTDMHAHFVYGMDDGAQSVQEMYAMLDMAQENHVTDLFATSHSTPGMRHFRESTYQERLREAAAYCRRMGYPIRLYTGTEILYTPALANYMEQKLLRTLGGSNTVLLEFVPHISFKDMEEALSLLQYYGYAVVLAHVERYSCLYSGARIRRVKEKYGVRLQVNSSTVIDGVGFFKTRRIHRWFKERLIDFVSSDMHNCDTRPNRMAEAVEILKTRYGSKYARRLTQGIIPEAKPLYGGQEEPENEE